MIIWLNLVEAWFCLNSRVYPTFPSLSVYSLIHSKKQHFWYSEDVSFAWGRQLAV